MSSRDRVARSVLLGDPSNSKIGTFQDRTVAPYLAI